MEKFETEQNFDFVTFYDGFDEKASQLYRLSGFIYSINQFYSTGRYLRVTFRRYIDSIKKNWVILLTYF